MERATPVSAERAPRRRRRPDDIVGDLLDAATVEFAEHGFAGASTRRIAERAGAHQPQINYHFESKEQLWHRVVDRLFEQLGAVAPLAPTADADPADLLVSGVRAFMRFTAEHPELNRIINLEATAPSPRLDWLVTTHLRPLFAVVDGAWSAIRAAGGGASLGSAEVWELITSYGALHFANAPMLTLLGTATGTGPDEADAHAERLLAILFP